MPHVLFLIEDGPYRYDTRVQREAQTLKQAGAQVTVISPSYHGEPLKEIVDGITVYGYRKPQVGQGFWSHIGEYVASLSQQSVLTLRVRRHGRLDVLHVANPPDLLWLVALPWMARGRKLVFDHHDLVPELFEERFGGGLIHRTVGLMERMSLKLADHVIAPNQSFKDIAMKRGGRLDHEVTIVRTGPDLAAFPPTLPDSRIRALGNVVVGYLGNMNPQDGLDGFIEMAHILRNQRNRTDIGFVMIGAGDAFDDLQALRKERGLGDAIRMTGRMTWGDELRAVLSATDICVQPDPPGPLNDRCTMVKTMEYMAMGKPVVAFDLKETRVTGGEAITFAADPTPRGLADAVEALADDPERRKELGALGRQRIETELGWPHQKTALLEAYSKVLPEGFST